MKSGIQRTQYEKHGKCDSVSCITVLSSYLLIKHDVCHSVGTHSASRGNEEQRLYDRALRQVQKHLKTIPAAIDTPCQAYDKTRVATKPDLSHAANDDHLQSPEAELLALMYFVVIDTDCLAPELPMK